MPNEMEGQAALVTGAGRGIGAAIARELARSGCDVVLVDVETSEGVEHVAGEVRALGQRALVLHADVAGVSEAADAVERAVEEFGRLDILVCNAGITRDAVIWKMTEDQWDDVVTVNLKGCFTYCRAVAPVFRRQRSGRIVTIASINGLRGKFGQSNYAASKAGVVALTKSMAKELGAFGVNANCVAPGFIRTEMTAALPADIVSGATAETALGRLGEPEDVARVVAFLCSGAARHVTGEVIKVDGGQYI